MLTQHLFLPTKKFTRSWQWRKRQRKQGWYLYWRSHSFNIVFNLHRLNSRWKWGWIIGWLRSIIKNVHVLIQAQFESLRSMRVQHLTHLVPCDLMDIARELPLAKSWMNKDRGKQIIDWSITGLWNSKKHWPQTNAWNRNWDRNMLYAIK